MTADQKTAWDKTYDEAVAKEDKKVAEWKTAAGYDKLTTEQQAVYDADILDWKKTVEEACKANAESISCKESTTLKDKEEARKVAINFYTKTADERKTYTENDKADMEKDLKTLKDDAVLAKAAEDLKGEAKTKKEAA